MFPLKTRKIGGYRFGQKTFYNNFHIGVDYEAKYVPLYAPFDGGVTTSVGQEGGNTIHFWPDQEKVEIRFLHLSKFIKTGRVKKGELIAITGNTGKETTIPHLHLDISKGSLQLNNIKNFIDPEKYVWEKGNMAQIKTQGKGPSRRIVLEAGDENEWRVLCKVYGKDPNQLDENE